MLLADLDGDGRAEVIAPVQSRDRLHAVSLAERRAEVVWEHRLASRLSGNAAVDRDNRHT
ncbi:MAG: hypothetical protein ACOC0O_02205 [Spirochaetota bacterium]